MNTTLPSSRQIAPTPTPTDEQSPQDRTSTEDIVAPPIDPTAFDRIDPKAADTIKSFQQWCIDHDVSIAKAATLTALSPATISRVFRGTYEGNYTQVADKIASYQQLHDVREGLQKEVFIQTAITKLIWTALDYALAQSTICTVEGESRMGKTASALAWRQGPHLGRSIFITAPTVGGKTSLLTDIARACGVRIKRPTQKQLFTSIARTLNPHRILIIDEAHRLLPSSDQNPNLCALETLRDLKDRSGFGLALLTTERFSDLLHGRYMFEQLIGRVSLPVVLPEELREQDILPIVTQFFQPSTAATTAALKIANSPGRLGILVERLKVAQSIARDAKQRCTSEHFLKALRFVAEMTAHRRRK